MGGEERGIKEGALSDPLELGETFRGRRAEEMTSEGASSSWCGLRGTDFWRRWRRGGMVMGGGRPARLGLECRGDIRDELD